MTLFLRSVGVTGAILFGFLFAITFVATDTLERSAKSFIQGQIEKEVREKFQQSKASSLREKAETLAKSLSMEEQQILEDLKNELPDKIASIIASMCGYDCEKKKRLSQSITSGFRNRISSLESAQGRLENIIKEKYIDITEALRADLRIFLGTNLAAFLAVLLISLVKPRAHIQLAVPGILIIISTIISSAIYLVGQDWFYTILYNDYMGTGYIAYISVIFGFLMDITLNRAQITTHILNGVSDALGSAFQVTPC
ncbi:hypothetical protein HCH_00928 [Hahella chejuensis KCTC 2396]|uniref:Uncharacterized protein n=1 Tax=Hahella chejuensis (strain KCTC 2396) TaxID=349521 RepID=Q2SNF6_HAHCH|nr:hypothetical protein [Hahella chejuensis]ABC27818.1 hypothetical protein HCH_00928 [Hahella chejuensis KCTC 2396]